MRKDEVLSYTPNLNKIKKFYNWSSKVSLDNGLNKTIQHYEKQKELCKYNYELP